jgi:hypothetical protein
MEVAMKNIFFWVVVTPCILEEAPMFPRNITTPSSGLKKERSKKLKEVGAQFAACLFWDIIWFNFRP